MAKLSDLTVSKLLGIAAIPAAVIDEVPHDVFLAVIAQTHIMAAQHVPVQKPGRK